MADVRVIHDFRLSDATTGSQQVAVDASGRLTVIGGAAQDAVIAGNPLQMGGRASSAVPTAMSADGDAVYPWLDRSGGHIVNGRDAHDAALDANTNPALIGGRASAAAPTDVSADGDATRIWVLRSGAQATVVTAAGALIGGDATNGLDVDVTRVTGTVTVDTELPAAAALSDTTGNPTTSMVGAANMLWDGTTNWIRQKSAATLADALANPGAGLAQDQAFLMGYNGTTWDRVRTANTGRLQVDVVSGGSADTPTNPVNVITTKASLAAGVATTTELRTSDLGGTTKKLTRVVCWSSVAFKAELDSVSNNVATIMEVSGALAGVACVFEPPGGRTGRNYWSTAFSANAGFDGWQVLLTNLDASEAADVYCTMHYED